MSTEMNIQEARLIKELKQVVDCSYTSFGIGHSQFIGEKGTLQAAANKVFDLTAHQGIANTHANILKVKNILDVLPGSGWQDAQQLCSAMEKGITFKP
jgi:hypothetical protein